MLRRPNSHTNRIHSPKAHRLMQCADQSLKAAFLPCRAQRSSSRESDDDTAKTSNHLLYLGKTDLPHHPVRVRHLPYSMQRMLLYGSSGYQEMDVSSAPEFYSLRKMTDLLKMTDCVQTSDGHLYTIARSHCSSVLVHYDELMTREKSVEIPYPLGCLSSLAANRSCTYLYGTNLELNCVLRFTGHDITLSKSESFGPLWRPFDCCTSQEFQGPDGNRVQFLFVSNLDTGICAFNMQTMEIVAECGDDLLPGAKYLAYDGKRSLLFVSCSCERLLRCYKFEAPPSLTPTTRARLSSASAASAAAATATAATNEGGDSYSPSLQKVGDFLVANRKPSVRSSGPQSIMWDPEMDQLAVVTWSHVKGIFSNKVFRVNI